MTPPKNSERRQKGDPLLTPNRLVALHIRRLRTERGWTQSELGERLAPFVGETWSVAMVSAAERSVIGPRLREFDADLLVAFARVFGVTVGALLSPGDVLMLVPDVPQGLDIKQAASFLFGPGEDALRTIREMIQKNLRETLQFLTQDDAPLARDSQAK